MKYDFGGWATRNDLQCADGRVIRKNAFKDQDGQTVSLVWNHNHTGVDNVLGLAHLENRDDGVYAYCKFNNTEAGRNAKEIVKHGDVRSLSIFANQLKQAGSDVVHGVIREVSLVLAGANPGAFIDDVIAHGSGEDGVVLGYDENITLYHADDEGDKKEVDEDNSKKKTNESDETIRDVFDTLTDKQKTVVYAMIGAVLEDKDKEDSDDNDDSEGGDDKMKHNVFENDVREDSYLSHAAQNDILGMAKNPQVGTFQNALSIYAEENALQHDATASGFVDSTIDKLFPEYQEVRPGAPELITSDQGWITRVLSKVHKSPISRVRTSQVDIRNIEGLRAHGYKKGKQKKLSGNFDLIRRTTDPQTVYVKSALNRDDIIDITDFDYVAYLYNIDRLQLNEELATAIMLGDNRSNSAENKIFPEHIRPIWTDDDLYTIHTDLDIAAAKKELQGTDTSVHFGDNYVYTEAIIEAVLHARENYKGSGTPDFYCTPALLNTMLLARDMNGRRIYGSVSELASSLNVSEICTAEQFAGKTRTTSDGETKKLLGMIVNLADYTMGATKGGEITHFTQFDLDFNQQKSLLETRCSGALTRVYSAIVLEEDITNSGDSLGD